MVSRPFGPWLHALRIDPGPLQMPVIDVDMVGQVIALDGLKKRDNSVGPPSYFGLILAALAYKRGIIDGLMMESILKRK